MYRDPDYSHLERELENLSRYEVKTLERELSDLYSNPRLNQLQNKDSILELEQRLLVVRKRKQYLNDKLKVADEVNELEKEVRTNKFYSVYPFFLTSIYGAITFGISYINSTEGYFGLGFGAFVALTSMMGLALGKKFEWGAANQLKELKESAEYKALSEDDEYKKLFQREFGKLPEADATEIKQLPSPERKSGVNWKLIEELLGRKVPDCYKEENFVKRYLEEQEYLNLKEQKLKK